MANKIIIKKFENESVLITEDNFVAVGSDPSKADLVDGKVPSEQLPSYVDDVLEYADLASLPVTGETGKIYVTIDFNRSYRWSGSGYVEISTQDLSMYIPKTQNTLMKEPTGFTEPGLVQEYYDSTARTITISGTVAAYYQGNVLAPVTNGWVSDAHGTANGAWFLYYDGSAFTWSQSPWEFDKAMIFYGYYGATDKFGIRECHGLMQWQAHKELHETMGTYRTAGGLLSAYTLASTTAANRRPDVSACSISDEDLPTINPALTSKLYTKVFNTGTGTSTTNFTVETADIVPLLANNPYYNRLNATIWSQTLMSNNSYMSVWLYAVPVTSDVGSQKYRYLWVQGQSNGNLATQQALSPSSLDLGQLATIATEFVCIAQVIINYTGGNWVITQVNNITGTRNSQLAINAVLPSSHAGLLGLDWPTSGHTGTANKLAGFDGSGFATEIVAPTAGADNIGYLNIPQYSISADITLDITHSGKHGYHPSSDTTPRTVTIDSNANVPSPIGTALTWAVDTSAGALTIEITSDTLVLAGAGTTGSRTLAANGVATALKVASTRWMISGTNLT